MTSLPTTWCWLRAHLALVATFCWLGIAPRAVGQTTYTVTTSADALLATGSPANPEGTDLTHLNFGGAGALAVAPASSEKGEFQSVIRFDLAGAPSLFNTAYGTNNWVVSSMALELTSNYGTAGVQPNNGIYDVLSGGEFIIEWLSNNDWAEGTGNPSLPTTDGVTFSSLPTLLSGRHEILSTNVYSPPGNNVHVTWPLPLNTNLVANIATGSSVSLLFYAADDQINYLFNSYSYGRGNQPLIHVTASPPLPIILAGYFTSASFHLTAHGVPNGQYQVQATTNLDSASWHTVGITRAEGSGSIQFGDTSATNDFQRFYRLSQ